MDQMIKQLCRKSYDNLKGGLYNMNCKKKLIPVMVIVVFSILSEYCSGEDVKMVEGKNNDAVVRAECINTSTGLTVGFRIEVINPSPDKNLVLVVRENLFYLFDVRLINDKGLDISPMLPEREMVEKLGPNMPKTYRHETILPGTNHFWFISVPSHVRRDPRKPTNDNNLAPIQNGEYKVEIKVNLGYSLQDKEKVALKFPEFHFLKLTLPRISIVVDSKLLGQNIEDIYRKKLSRFEAEKQAPVSVTNKSVQ